MAKLNSFIRGLKYGVLVWGQELDRNHSHKSGEEFGYYISFIQTKEQNFYRWDTILYALISDKTYNFAKAEIAIQSEKKENSILEIKVLEIPPKFKIPILEQMKEYQSYLESELILARNPEKSFLAAPEKTLLICQETTSRIVNELKNQN